MNLIAWQEVDGIVRIKKFCDELMAWEPLLYNYRIDEITACGTDVQSTQLWFGHASGRITVYQCTENIIQSKHNINRQQNSTENKMSYNSAFGKIMIKNSTKKFNDINLNDPNKCNNNTLKWKESITLIKHTDEITGITISKEFRIVVSISKDGLAVIWDYNK